MASGPEEDLLRMSLTGALPAASQASFDKEKDLGNHAFREGRYTDAVRHYTAAEQINPLSPVPPANRAMAYLKLSRFHNAKADSSVALELYHALPRDAQPASLPVKILLRRATANLELMLYALAAEDYAAVLEEDAGNQVAKAQLKLLKDKFGVVPGTDGSARRPASTESSASARGKIQLVSEATTARGPVRQQRMLAHAPISTTIQDETALVELPQNVMQNLVSQWSSVPPHSASEFERAWKSLQGDKPAQASYLLRIVGHVRLANGLLGESLTPQLLEELVSVMTIAVERDPSTSRSVADVLFALTKVSRFDMLLMFLSPADKRPMSSLLDSLKKNGVSAQQIAALTACYL